MAIQLEWEPLIQVPSQRFITDENKNIIHNPRYANAIRANSEMNCADALMTVSHAVHELLEIAARFENTPSGGNIPELQEALIYLNDIRAQRSENHASGYLTGEIDEAVRG